MTCYGSRVIRLAHVLFLFAITAPASFAGNEAASFAGNEAASWANWRGPLGTGGVAEGHPPVSWSESKNVRWKIRAPGHGSGSPIVWQDRVYLLSAIKTDRQIETPAAQEPEPEEESREGAGRRRGQRAAPPSHVHEFVIVAVDREDGSIVWQETAREEVPHEGTHDTASFASASPVTDGELLSLAEEIGGALWNAWGMTFRGWACAEQGQREEGIAQLEQGLALSRQTGAELARPHFLIELAKAYGQAEEPEKGLSLLEEALDIMPRTGERWAEAEAYRIRGELLLTQESQKSKGIGQMSKVEEAESCFQQAIDIAQQQSAKSWELRAAMSLARLWQQQGKQGDARHLLAPVYNWFTEGFDTPDLQDAKTLLDELSEGA